MLAVLLDVLRVQLVSMVPLETLAWRALPGNGAPQLAAIVRRGWHVQLDALCQSPRLQPATEPVQAVPLVDFGQTVAILRQRALHGPGALRGST